MSESRTTAITGASGFLGGALLERCLKRGRAKALFRRHDDVSAGWARRGCEVVFGDLDDVDALSYLVRDADVVHHCAALMGKGDADGSHRVNVVGTENLVRASVAARTRRFLYVSSISVFAATRTSSGTITEAVEPSDTDRLNDYGRTKYAGELAVRQLTRGTDTQFTIIRPTNIYGARSGPWFLAFERLLRWLPVAIGDFPIDVVYVDDVVDAMVEAAAAPGAADRVFHVSHQSVPMRQFIRRVGSATGHRAWMLPRSADRALRLAIDRAYRTTTRRHMSLSLVRPVSYPHTLAQGVFGYRPRIDLDEGFDRIARVRGDSHG